MKSSSVDRPEHESVEGNVAFDALNSSSQFVLAMGVTALVLGTLRGLGLLESWLARRHSKARKD